MNIKYINKKLKLISLVVLSFFSFYFFYNNLLHNNLFATAVKLKDNNMDDQGLTYIHSTGTDAIVNGYDSTVAPKQTEFVIPDEVIFNDGTTCAVTKINFDILTTITGMTKLTIPASVTSLNENMVDNCTKLTEIKVEDGNTTYVSVNGVLFSYGTDDENNKTASLLCYPAAHPSTTDDKYYAVPETITVDGTKYAVNSVKDSTFGNFSKLNLIVGHKSLFSDLNLSNTVLASNFKKIVFHGNCDDEIEDKNVVMTQIVRIGENLMHPSEFNDSISKDSCWCYYTEVAEAKIYSLFDFSTEITSSSTSSPMSSLSDLYYCYVEGGLAYLPDSSTETASLIGYITEQIPESGEVSIQKTVKDLDGSDYTVTEIGQSALNDCSEITKLTLPDSIETINERAFRGTSITTLTIPASVISLNENMVDNCTKLTEIKVEDGNTTYVSVDGVLFSYGADAEGHKKASLELCPIAHPGTGTDPDKKEYAVPETISVNENNYPVSSILYCSFEDCAFKTIFIPKTIKTISYQSFYDCPNLEVFVIANDSSLTSAADIFYGCPNLSVIVMKGNKLLSVIYDSISHDEFCIVDFGDVAIQLVQPGATAIDPYTLGFIDSGYEWLKDGTAFDIESTNIFENISLTFRKIETDGDPRGNNSGGGGSNFVPSTVISTTNTNTSQGTTSTSSTTSSTSTAFNPNSILIHDSLNADVYIAPPTNKDSSITNISASTISVNQSVKTATTSAKTTATIQNSGITQNKDQTKQYSIQFTNLDPQQYGNNIKITFYVFDMETLSWKFVSYTTSPLSNNSLIIHNIGDNIRIEIEPAI